MRSQPNRDYVSNDVVMTPDGLACALVDALRPTGRVLEPCSGGGAFVRALQQVGADVAMCEVSEATDFFGWHAPVDWVVTNPPWSQFARFLEHSLRLADDVALLATVNHWWTKRRVRTVLDGGFGYRRLVLVDWPQTFPSSGFQLGMMHVSRGWTGAMTTTDLRTQALRCVTA